MRKIVRRVGLLGLATLLLLEVVLQIGSVVVWLTHDAGSGAVQTDRSVVLCIGDSFTFGLGASDEQHRPYPTQSYPAQLQRVLDRRAPDTWHVVNRGFPGMTSRELLLRWATSYVVIALLAPRLAEFALCLRLHAAFR